MPDLSFWARHGRFIRPGLVFAPMLICLLCLMYRSGRRRPAVVKSRGKPPPYFLPIRVHGQRPEYLSRRPFFETANRLRTRIESGVRLFDTDRTISRTIQKAGFPDPCYRAVTRPAEYLLLIDLAAADDHYAHFIRSMAEALAGEGVFVDIFYYSEDPRICFRGPGEARIRLSDLPARYAGHRLALAGECNALLNPGTGRLDPWAGIFEKWPDRAVLTPGGPGNGACGKSPWPGSSSCSRPPWTDSGPWPAISKPTTARI